MKEQKLKMHLHILDLNSEDNLAFERIINIPRRGIGAVFIKIYIKFQ